MKLLLATLGSLAITGSGAAVLSNSTNHLVSTQQKVSAEEIASPSTLSESSQTIEEYLTNNPDNTLKGDILNSLFFNNEKIEVNVLTLEQYKNNPTIYLMLTGDELKDKLLEMYQNDLLSYNEETQKFSFIENSVSNYSWGAWAESYWYWFGYWKLHFNHEASQDLSAILLTASSIGEFAEAAGALLPEFGAALAGAAIFLMANSYILSSNDYGNGVWIGFWGLIPDLGWGSN